MKARILLLLLVSGIVAGTMGQNTIDLTFTVVEGTAYIQLDSIKVMNRTQWGDTALYRPDTVLSFNYGSIPDISDEKNTFKVLQNYPNPVADQTTVSFYVPEKDKVSIIVTDIRISWGELLSNVKGCWKEASIPSGLPPVAGTCIFSLPCGSDRAAVLKSFSPDSIQVGQPHLNTQVVRLFPRSLWQ